MAVSRQTYANEDPTIGDLAGMAAVNAIFELVDTIKIGQVVAYNTATCTADIELLVYEPFEDEDGEIEWEQPEGLFDVPVGFPGTASHGLSFPLATGDFVLVLITERSIDEWLATGEPGPVTDLRRWDGQDAFAIPVVSPRTPPEGTENDATVLYGSEVRLSSPSASASVSRDPDVQATLADIKTTTDALRLFQTTFLTALTAAETAANAAVPGFGTAVFAPMKNTLNLITVPSYTPSSTAASEVKVP